MYVSMSSAGSSHFYSDIDTGDDFEELCQCPRRALLISTLGLSGLAFAFISMCQCPRRALLISTWRTVVPPLCQQVVSMPSAGSSHFYPQHCQLRAALHRGVNALGGLFSFLPKVFVNRRISSILVSMPSAGSSHFYVNKNFFLRRNTSSVNALGGLFSFLQYPLETRINTGFPASFLQVFV